MASNIQHTLYELEVTPPPGVWPEIAARLNNEFDADEVPVAQKMYALEVPPPSSAWENIVAALPQPEPVKTEGKLITPAFRRVTAAVAAIVLLTAGAWYFLNYSGGNTGNAVAAKQSFNKKPVPNNTTAAEPIELTAPKTGEQPTAKVAQKSTSSAQPRLLTKSERGSYAHRRRSQPVYYYAADYQPVATDYAGIDEVQAVNFTSSTSPNVEAPLIRDANGQIILDKKLITSPDDCYITITGPNGQQTRISSKFVHIISSLNADLEPQDYFDFMMHENSLWKVRFHEWKNKMLNQSSFIPTATNFTDILELKDLLLEEN